MNEKWTNALSKTGLVSNQNVKYDPFFDYNIAFWVQSLDEFITHWQSQDIELEYFGIEWELPSDLSINLDDASYLNNQWYSILLHSPNSAIIFEFVSYRKPSKYYDLQWITDTIPRATFQIVGPEEPWNRPDKASIVPIRIAHSSTNPSEQHTFYSEVFSADLIWSIDTVDAHHFPISAVFLQLPQTHIEIQFIQRPVASTYGDFTVETYEDLLEETHDSILLSPFCGTDRWMDNHYALSLRDYIPPCFLLFRFLRSFWGLILSVILSFILFDTPFCCRFDNNPI